MKIFLRVVHEHNQSDDITLVALGRGGSSGQLTTEANLNCFGFPFNMPQSTRFNWTVVDPSGR
jgi:hypothetical protein